MAGPDLTRVNSSAQPGLSAQIHPEGKTQIGWVEGLGLLRGVEDGVSARSGIISSGSRSRFRRGRRRNRLQVQAQTWAAESQFGRPDRKCILL